MNLIYESSFKFVLSKFKDNDIALELLSIEDKDNEQTDINYIDISDKEGLLTYRSDIKISERIKRDYRNDLHLLDNALVNPVIRMDYYRGAPKIEVKIGRLTQKLLTLSKKTFNNKDVEDFVNRFIALYKLSLGTTFKILQGKDIIKAYDKNNYSSIKGIDNELFKSCMSNRDTKFFDIYTQNSACSILVAYTDDGEIYGRGLLWNAEFKGEPIKILDRVYTLKESDEQIFRQWAKDNGYICRKKNNNCNEENAHRFINTDGQEIDIMGAIVRLQKSLFAKYPYLDTFKFVSRKENVSSNSTDRYYRHYIHLCSTCGDFGGDDGVYLVVTVDDCEVERDLCVRSNYHGGWVSLEKSIKVYYSVQNDRFDYVSKNLITTGETKEVKTELVFSKKLNTYYFRDFSRWSDYHQSWISRADSHYVEENNDYILKSCIDEYIKYISINIQVTPVNVYHRKISILKKGDNLTNVICSDVYWFNKGVKCFGLIIKPSTYPYSYLFNDMVDGSHPDSNLRPNIFGFWYSYQIGSSGYFNDIPRNMIDNNELYLIQE